MDPIAGPPVASELDQQILFAAMTLIATAISQHGIVHASDSNLTGGSEPAIPGQKLFKLKFADAALAVAGRFSVGGTRMDVWLPSAISSYATGSPTLRGFAEYLRERLDDERTPDERARATLFHIAGYVEVGGSAHPELVFVRNFEDIDKVSGEYIRITDKFEVTEDFWCRDYANPEVRSALAAGGEQRYFNGFPAGRIAYLDFVKRFNNFLGQVWGEKTWKFRPPRNVDELGAFVELEVRAICTMFGSSDYDATYIGGDVQIEKIPAPSNAVRL